MSGTLDLTSGGIGTIAGAIFTTNTEQPTGTGYINSFVRIQDIGEEDGFNTDADVGDINADEGTDMLAGNFTRDIQLDDVPIVIVDGVAYREFRLDINEPSGGDNELLSLDELRIYTSDTGALTSLDGLTAVYDMDSAGDATVLMDYSLNSGSGSGDISVYIPDSFFAGAEGDDFVYLYSQFGLTAGHGAADGFEEWSIVEEEELPEEPPPPTDIDIEKDVDIDVDTELTLDVKTDVDVTLSYDAELSLDALEGNGAELVADVEAIGSDSLATATTTLLVTDSYSGVTVEAGAYVA